MNDAIRKRAASVLGKQEDAISDADVEQAFDLLQERDTKNAMETALTDARAKLQAHVERGAVSTAAFDAAVADIEKGETPAVRKALTSQWSNSWSVLDGGTIALEPKGKGGEGPGVEQDAVSASVSDRVAKRMAEDTSLTPLAAHQQVMGALTKEERAAYEAEAQSLSDWQRGE